MKQLCLHGRQECSSLVVVKYINENHDRHMAYLISWKRLFCIALCNCTIYMLFFMPLCWNFIRKSLKLLRSAIFELWDCNLMSNLSQYRQKADQKWHPKALTSLKSRYICIVSLEKMLPNIPIRLRDKQLSPRNASCFIIFNRNVPAPMPYGSIP